MPVFEGNAPAHQQFRFYRVRRKKDLWVARLLPLGITAYGPTKVDAKIKLMDAVAHWAQLIRGRLEIEKADPDREVR